MTGTLKRNEYLQMKFNINLISIHLICFRYITVILLTTQTATADKIAGKDPTCTYSDEEMFDYEQCINESDAYFCSVNQTVQDWFQELYSKAINDTGNPKRIRREIRTLSRHERHVLFRAINDLKNDKVYLFNCSVAKHLFSCLGLSWFLSTL